MSLVRIAARISAVEALKGRTLVGDNVLDSEIGAITIGADGDARTDEDKPFIAVYTDASSSTDGPLRSLAVNGVTDFLFETGVTATMTVTDPVTDMSELLPGIPATDKSFEFMTDMIVRQISDVLTDPDNPWSQIFLGLTSSLISVKRARTSGDASGVRLAAQQVTVQATMINDPLRGADLKDTHPLMKFFALAANIDDPVVATQIALMQAQITGNASDYAVMQQRFGRTTREAQATGAFVVGGVITTPVIT